MTRAVSNPESGVDKTPDNPPDRSLAVKALVSHLQSFKLSSPVLALADGNLHVIGADAEVCKAIEAAVGEMLPPDIGESLMVINGAPFSDYVEIADLAVVMRPEVVTHKCEPNAPRLVDEGAVPGVLTWKAVRDGVMPPAGESGLPDAIAELVPESYRFWKHEGARACEIRNALFDSGIADRVRMVDGSPRLVEQRLFAVTATDVDKGAALVMGAFESEAAMLIVESTCVMWSIEDGLPTDIEDGQTLVFDPAVTKEWAESIGIAAIAARVEKLSCNFFLPVPDSARARHELSKIGKPFSVRRSAMANLLFLSNAKIAKQHVDMIDQPSVDFDRQENFELLKQSWGGHELWHLSMGGEYWVLQEDPTSAPSLSMLKSAESVLDGEIEKIDSGRAVYLDDFGDRRRMRLDGKSLSGVCSFEQIGGSVVWQFGRPETETELSKSYDVRQFLVKAEDERFVYGIVLEPEVVDAQKDIYDEETVRVAAHEFMAKFQNIGIMHQTLSKDVQILESFIVPAEFESGGRTVKKGTWILATRIISDKLWKAVKSGTFGGYSIGGSAIRTPV